MKKERIVKMVEMEMELDQDLIEPMKKYALKMIAEDEQALLNYGINLALRYYIEADGQLNGIIKEKHEKLPGTFCSLLPYANIFWC